MTDATKARETLQASVDAPSPFTWWEGGRDALLDQIICECGWKSATFFDGECYAYDQWKKHAAEKHTPC